MVEARAPTNLGEKDKEKQNEKDNKDIIPAIGEDVGLILGIKLT